MMVGRLGSGVRRWAVWQLPAPARRYITVVIVLAIGCLAALATAATFRVADVVAGASFLACGVVSVEVFRRVGAPHRRLDRPYHDLLSASLIPAIVVLPPVYAAFTPLLMHALVQVRVMPLAPVKRVFNASVGVLICGAAAVTHDLLVGPLSHSGVNTLDDLAGLGALAAAAVVYLALNKAFMVGIIHFIAPATPWRTLRGDAESWVLAVVDVCAGMMLAVIWVVSPALILVALMPILLLQRTVVHTHLVASTRHDAKTGLANPPWWRQEATRAVTRARRGGDVVAVVLLDLDDFKVVNDRHGHLVGDTVLIAVADTLRSVVRPGDLVGRMGGDEFTVLLSGTNAAQALSTGERLRDRLNEVRHPVRHAGPPLQVTASVGVAVFGPAGVDLDDLLGSADASMYEAKAMGGNLVRLAGGLPSPLPIEPQLL